MPWLAVLRDWLIGILIGLLLLYVGGASALQRGGDGPTLRAAQAVDDGPPSDRLIVKLRDAQATAIADPSARPSVRVAGNRAGVRLSRLRGMAQAGGHVLQLDRRLGSAALRQLADDIRNGDNAVEYVELDRILTAQWLPNDPQFINQWDLSDATAGLNLPAAWDLGRGAGVVVAVIDTGVRPHADLSANLLPGYDFISMTTVANDGNGRDADASDPGDWAPAGACGTGSVASNSSWHGTHVAGTIAAVANNGVGMAGVAPGARILPLRVLGRCGGYTSDIADAIIWAAGGTITGVPANPTPAKVLNLSLGGRGACDLTTQNAINSARSRGAVVVVAAGNSAADASGYSPASCAGVVSVAAVGRTGARASYSNYGASVDLAAPGGDAAFGILSTLNAGTTTPGADTYRSYMGTSMAAPHVAGVAALMRARNPALTPDQVETLLKSSAVARGFPVACSQCGSGLLDAHRAIVAAGGTSTTTPAPLPAPAPNPTPAPAPVTQVIEVENNNTLARAQKVLVVPSQLKGTIGSASDTDYVSVVIPVGKTLSVALAPNARSDYDLMAYTTNGTLLARSVLGMGQIDRLSARNAGSTPLTLVLRVVRYSGLSGATGTYTLSMTF
ncbi:S8 family peptidase [Sphaerotilus mobilis]|nr:S8 family peptidase [Sphaerotilus mobilis]